MNGYNINVGSVHADFSRADIVGAERRLSAWLNNIFVVGSL
jgi:hypothetical protein